MIGWDFHMIFPGGTVEPLTQWENKVEIHHLNKLPAFRKSVLTFLI